MKIGSNVVVLNQRGGQTDIEGIIRGTATVINDNEQLVPFYVVELDKDHWYCKAVWVVDGVANGMILVHQSRLREFQ